MTIIGTLKRYYIPFKAMEPAERPSRGGWPDVYLNERLGFYAFTDTTPPRQDPRAANHLVDALIVLKTAASGIEKDEEETFQEAARAYRASDPKPEVPEAAHRFDVQAVTITPAKPGAFESVSRSKRLCGSLTRPPSERHS
jgi:hypothetical protein